MRSRSGYVRITGLLGLIALLSVGTSVADAAEAQEVPATTLQIFAPDGDLVSRTSTPGSRGEIACDLRLENPHWSSGGESVIFKSRISCHGDGPPTVTIRIIGNLGSVSGPPGPVPAQGPPVPRAHSDEAQVVSTNTGQLVTYYTPQQNREKVRGSAWYEGYVTGEMISTPVHNIGHAATNRVYVSTP
jgi:hypothetical protein